MKVCLVCDSVPGIHREWSGAEQVCLRLCQMLRRNGYRTAIVTAKFERTPSVDGFFEVRSASTWPRASNFMKLFPFNIVSLFQAIGVLKRTQPNVVHFHGKILFFPVLIAAKILKIPTVLTVLDYWIICPIFLLMKPYNGVCESFHGPECYKCLPRELLPPSIRRLVPEWTLRLVFLLRSKAFDFFIRKLDAFVVLSRTSKERLEWYGLHGDKIHVIYHYEVDRKKYARLAFKPLECPTVLLVGMPRPHKGVHILVEAMVCVTREVPTARLWVVGAAEPPDPVYSKRIADMIGEMGLKDHVSFLGKKSNEEVLELISRSDVVAVAEQYPNDFGPIALVEAMSLGKPVVASEIGGIPEFIKDGANGLLVPHDQPDRFAEKIVWLLRHKESACQIGENARRSVSFLSDERLIQKVIELYRNVSSRGQ